MTPRKLSPHLREGLRHEAVELQSEGRPLERYDLWTSSDEEVFFARRSIAGHSIEESFYLFDRYIALDLVRRHVVHRLREPVDESLNGSATRSTDLCDLPVE